MILMSKPLSGSANMPIWGDTHRHKTSLSSWLLKMGEPFFRLRRMKTSSLVAANKDSGQALRQSARFCSRQRLRGAPERSLLFYKRASTHGRTSASNDRAVDTQFLRESNRIFYDLSLFFFPQNVKRREQIACTSPQSDSSKAGCRL